MEKFICVDECMTNLYTHYDNKDDAKEAVLLLIDRIWAADDMMQSPTIMISLITQDFLDECERKKIEYEKNNL